VGLIEQEGIGQLPYIGLPTKPYRRPASAAPGIGEHSFQILNEAGIELARINQLIKDGVVVQLNQ